jgi:acyl-CoA dehydrogenase
VTEPEKRHNGISAFIVDRESNGITANVMHGKMGHRSSDTAEIVFDEVRVPAANRLGKEGDGFKLAMQTFDRTRITVGASGVGIARSALDKSVRFAKERSQFGQQIANFQAVQFMLADMEIKIQTARLITLYAAWLVDHGKAYSQATAISKCYGSDIAMQCAEDAVQIHGGYGYFREYGVEKLMRDAKLLQIYEGTNQIQRLVIAKNLLRG